MELTRKVGLRVGVMLTIVSMLCMAGCSSGSKDGSVEYKTKVKAESTADSSYNMLPSYDQMGGLEQTPGEAAYSINLNQIGYRVKDQKVAVVNNYNGVSTYQVLDGAGNTVYSGELIGQQWDSVNKGMIQFADFSAFTTPGSYYLVCGNDLYSDEFVIEDDVYQKYYSAIGDYFANTIKNLQLTDDGDSTTKIKAKVYGTKQEVDVSGGWYDLKERGQYTVDSTTTIASLLLMYDSFENMDLQDEEITELQSQRVLYIVRKELEWLLCLQNEQGGVYHKVTTSGGDKDNGELVLYPVSTYATADFAAVMAKAYPYFVQSDYEFANSCLAAAQKAWYYLQNNPDSVDFINPEGVETPEYTDDDDRDERFWAAVELSLTTKRSDYVTYVTDNIDTGFYIGFTWQKVAGFGVIDALKKGEAILPTSTYARMGTLLDSKVHTIKEHVDSVHSQVQYDGSVSFQQIISEGITLYLMDQHNKDKSLYAAASAFLDYLMGANPYSVDYIGEFSNLGSLDMDYVAKIAILLVGINEEQ